MRRYLCLWQNLLPRSTPPPSFSFSPRPCLRCCYWKQNAQCSSHFLQVTTLFPFFPSKPNFKEKVVSIFTHSTLFSKHFSSKLTQIQWLIVMNYEDLDRHPNIRQLWRVILASGLLVCQLKLLVSLHHNPTASLIYSTLFPSLPQVLPSGILFNKGPVLCEPNLWPGFHIIRYPLIPFPLTLNNWIFTCYCVIILLITVSSIKSVLHENKSPVIVHYCFSST